MTKLAASLLTIAALTSVASAKEDWCKPRGEASLLAAKMHQLMGRIEVGECQYVDAYISSSGDLAKSRSGKFLSLMNRM